MHAKESEKAATYSPPTFSIGAATSVRSGFNHFCVRKGKRHGWSSGMRRGRRSSSTGVRTPVRPSVQGPVGEAPATAPSTPPSTTGTVDGWVACLVLVVFLLSSLSPDSSAGNRAHRKTRHQAQHTCSSALRHRYRRLTGAACPPRIPLRLACRRGFEPTSSGQQPAAQPLRHAAKNPGRGPPALIKPVSSDIGSAETEPVATPPLSPLPPPPST